VLGLLICLIGGTGLFASLTDSAHTGTNTINSSALPSSADLQLAAATHAAAPIVCDTFSDNLATGLFDLTDSLPQFHYGAFLCIKNAGSQPVSLSGAVDQLTDVDTDCTGDEADSGDSTCGGDAVGELSGVFEVTFNEASCTTSEFVAAYGPSLLSTLDGTPTAMGTLGAGETKCFTVDIGYGYGVSGAEKQRAQSDKVTWRFVFTGQA
jgi:hypothetical protein